MEASLDSAVHAGTDETAVSVAHPLHPQYFSYRFVSGALYYVLHSLRL